LKRPFRREPADSAPLQISGCGSIAIACLDFDLLAASTIFCCTASSAFRAALEADSIPHIYEAFAGGRERPSWQKHVANTLRFAS
jgi:hypothetical protein